ncbi:MAG: UbiX family flavin prenyltransferase, partial [Chloroflexi bacterium]|nr:UbiX family flavin prenyltransferase [Chloroflexota bacterium]
MSGSPESPSPHPPGMPTPASSHTRPRTLLAAASGASGSIYLQRLLTHALPQVERVYFTFSRHAAEVMLHELKFDLMACGGDLEPLLGARYDNLILARPGDMRAPFASGSGVCDSTIIVPCSMGMVGRIAAGISDDLIARAADVALKERRRLILCPRETPLSVIHLRNMLAVSEAGAIVAPAMPNFYTHPASLDDAVDTVVW